MTEGHIPVTPPRKTLFAVLGGGTVVAAVILVGAVLPAEFHIDPLGIGKATGLLKLSQPEEVKVALPAGSVSNEIAHTYPAPFRTDTISIPLESGDNREGRNELEWKVRMKKGQTLVYSWSVEAPPEEFYVDFHGESEPTPEKKVISYHEGISTGANGSMVAPFDGIHGWYLQNQSAKAVVVHLKLSGFYEMRQDPTAPMEEPAKAP
jgi:hypothetical protein